jgi:transcriptional regulator with XRE-family HTH domain
MSKLSELVKNRRETMRLSQQAIADRAGVSRAYISKIEIDMPWSRTPLAEAFPKLAKALELNEDELREAAGCPSLKRLTARYLSPKGGRMWKSRR